MRTGGETSMAKTGKNDPGALSALPAGAPVTAPRSEGPRPSRKAKGLSLTRRVTPESATAAADAGTFEAEWRYMLVRQVGAVNSPVWLNCGLWHEYKIKGSGGDYAVDLATGKAYSTEDAYTRRQVSACFIQSWSDGLDSI